MPRKNIFNGKKYVPYHIGCYARWYGNEVFFCYWDGKSWGEGRHQIHLCFKARRSDYQDLPWFGLDTQVIFPRTGR